MNPSTTHSLYAELSQTLADGDLDEAIAKLETICNANPGDGGAIELRGLISAQTGRPNLAVHFLTKAEQITSLEPLSYRIMAFSYIAIGREIQGVELLHRIAVRHADQPWFNRLLARDLLNLKHPDLAADALFRGLEVAPKDDTTWHDLAVTQSVLGEPVKTCLHSVYHAIALAPAVVEYRVTASSLLIRLDEPLLAYRQACEVVTPERCDLNCECCLWRLIYLFDCFDDLSRMAACYRQLETVVGQR